MTAGGIGTTSIKNHLALKQEKKNKQKRNLEKNKKKSWHCQSTAGGIGTTSPENNKETHSKTNLFPDLFGCVIRNITTPFQDILSIVSIEATSKKAKTSSMKLRGKKWQPW